MSYADKELTEQKSHLSRTERMKQALEEQLAPVAMTLTDDSTRHAGHAGAAPGGETHYSLKVVSRAFEGLGRVARQRLVYQALGEEFETGLHALAMDLKTPAEAGV